MKEVIYYDAMVMHKMLLVISGILLMFGLVFRSIEFTNLFRFEWLRAERGFVIISYH